LDRLEQDADPASPEFAEIRSRMIVQDDAHLTHTRFADGWASVSGERQLWSLVEHNPQNRMALEYWMAVQMIDKNLEAIAEALPRVKESCYRDTPRLYEEAAMIYAVEHPEKAVFSEAGLTVGGCPISMRTADACRRLMQVRRMFHQMDNPAAKKVVAREMGGSYFYYYFYGAIPLP
jgi:hypothetical protein